MVRRKVNGAILIIGVDGDNPEGCEKVAGGRSEAKTTLSAAAIIC